MCLSVCLSVILSICISSISQTFHTTAFALGRVVARVPIMCTVKCEVASKLYILLSFGAGTTAHRPSFAIYRVRIGRQVAPVYERTYRIWAPGGQTECTHTHRPHPQRAHALVLIMRVSAFFSFYSMFPVKKTSFMSIDHFITFFRYPIPFLANIL